MNSRVKWSNNQFVQRMDNCHVDNDQELKWPRNETDRRTAQIISISVLQIIVQQREWRVPRHTLTHTQLFAEFFSLRTTYGQTESISLACPCQNISNEQQSISTTFPPNNNKTHRTPNDTLLIVYRNRKKYETHRIESLPISSQSTATYYYPLASHTKIV